MAVFIVRCYNLVRLVPKNLEQTKLWIHTLPAVMESSKVSQKSGAVGGDELDHLHYQIDEDAFKYAPDFMRKTSEFTCPLNRHTYKWATKKNKFKKTKQPIEYKTVSPKEYQKIVETFPQIEEMDEVAVQEVMFTGNSYGFSPTKIAKMLCRYPEFLNNYTTSLPNGSLIWRGLGFTESERCQIFVRHPTLLNVPAEIIYKRFAFLTEYFSRKQIAMLIKNNPLVLVESESIIKEKMELLWKKYSHSTLTIAGSEAISRSIMQIKCRHQFLIRAGLIKTMPFHKFLKLQAQEEGTKSRKVRDKYFPPCTLLDSGEEKFLKICTNNTLTLTDMHVFEDIYRKELEDAEDLDSSDVEEEAEEEEEKDLTNEEDIMEEEPDHVVVSATRYRLRNSSNVYDAVDAKDFYY